MFRVAFDGPFAFLPTNSCYTLTWYTCSFSLSFASLYILVLFPHHFQAFNLHLFDVFILVSLMLFSSIPSSPRPNSELNAPPYSSHHSPRSSWTLCYSTISISPPLSSLLLLSPHPIVPSLMLLISLLIDARCSTLCTDGLYSTTYPTVYSILSPPPRPASSHPCPLSLCL